MKIVEAALVLPLAILITVGLIMLNLSYYNDLVERVEAHNEARIENDIHETIEIRQIDTLERILE